MTEIPLGDDAWIVDSGLVLQVGMMGIIVDALLVHLLSFGMKKDMISNDHAFIMIICGY